MKKSILFYLVIFTLLTSFGQLKIADAQAFIVLKDIPLDACIFLDKYDSSFAAYVISTRDKFLEARNPSFLSINEVNSLEEANNCDIAVRISQPSTSSVRVDVFSTETKKMLVSAKDSGFFFSANKIYTQVFSALGEDTSLGKRVIQERNLRLAKLERKKEESVKKISQPDKQDSAAAIITSIQSDVDELPLKNARSNKNAYAIVKTPQSRFCRE
jgi:hypothetical protein